MNRGLRVARRTVHWLLLGTIAAYILTGFGITEFRVVETITFGLLGKALAFKIHDWLLVPFIVLLGLHIFLVYFRKNKKD